VKAEQRKMYTPTTLKHKIGDPPLPAQPKAYRSRYQQKKKKMEPHAK